MVKIFNITLYHNTVNASQNASYMISKLVNKLFHTRLFPIKLENSLSLFVALSYFRYYSGDGLYDLTEGKLTYYPGKGVWDTEKNRKKYAGRLAYHVNGNLVYPQYVQLDTIKKYGWDTNTATRPAMLSQLKEAIDKKLLRVYDKITIEEMYSFVVVRTTASVKAQAEAGMHDDLVMSLAIAWQLYQLAEFQSGPINMDDLPKYKPLDSHIGI